MGRKGERGRRGPARHAGTGAYVCERAATSSFMLLHGPAGRGSRPPGRLCGSNQPSGFRAPQPPSAGGRVLFPTSCFYEPSGVPSCSLERKRETGDTQDSEAWCQGLAVCLEALRGWQGGRGQRAWPPPLHPSRSHLPRRERSCRPRLESASATTGRPVLGESGPRARQRAAGVLCCLLSGHGGMGCY